MIRFIRKNKTSGRVGWTPVHLMREARAGRFPAPVKIGPNSVGFVESEVDEWMKARMANRETERSTDARKSYGSSEGKS